MEQAIATVEAIHAYLDERPEDWAARSALADLLLDLGRDREASYQRWLVVHRKSPHRYHWGSGRYTWQWWATGYKTDDLRSSIEKMRAEAGIPWAGPYLPCVLHGLLGRGRPGWLTQLASYDGLSGEWSAPTRQEAEAALFAALVMVEEI